MTIERLEIELEYNRKEWIELENYFNDTEQRVLDNMRIGNKEIAKKLFYNLREIEIRMRPIRNKLSLLYENLEQLTIEKNQENKKKDISKKGIAFFENRYKINQRSLNLIGLLSRNGIVV